MWISTLECYDRLWRVRLGTFKLPFDCGENTKITLHKLKSVKAERNYSCLLIYIDIYIKPHWTLQLSCWFHQLYHERQAFQPCQTKALVTGTRQEVANLGKSGGISVFGVTVTYIGKLQILVVTLDSHFLFDDHITGVVRLWNIKALRYTQSLQTRSNTVGYQLCGTTTDMQSPEAWTYNTTTSRQASLPAWPSQDSV